MKLYPLKFQPLFKYRIWGGNKLKSELNKVYDGDFIGESWEISDVEEDETIVSNGDLKGYTLKELTRAYKDAFLGKKVYSEFAENFPLLIKFIDAKAPLSIQVHPSDDLALKRHKSFGKNEMWYIMQADENAEIIVGFENDTTKDTYQAHLNNGNVLDLMHHEKVSKGDTYHIPTGRIHAIGAGVMLAEIQQTSDITYRIYDYDRVDKTSGKTRELHNDLAKDVIDFNKHDSYKVAYSSNINTSNKLVHSPYFKTNLIPVSGNIKKDYSHIDSFVIFMCVKGNTTITYNSIAYTLNYGETILIPACINNIEIEATSAQLLEVYL